MVVWVYGEFWVALGLNAAKSSGEKGIPLLDGGPPEEMGLGNADCRDDTDRLGRCEVEAATADSCRA